jgi:hypothetical protein
MVLNIDANAWIALGLETAGFPPHRQQVRDEQNLRRFMAHYGASPESHAAIFTDFQTTQVADAHIDTPSAYYFLMAMHWLQCYRTNEEIAGTFKVDEKTVRTHVWKYVHAIQALKAAKVRQSLPMM